MAPETLRPHLSGASLLASGKTDGGIRPIAIGEVFRRMAVRAPLPPDGASAASTMPTTWALARVVLAAEMAPDSQWAQEVRAEVSGPTGMEMECPGPFFGMDERGQLHAEPLHAVAAGKLVPRGTTAGGVH